MLRSIINVKMAKPAGWGAADFVAKIYLPSEMKIRPNLRLIFWGMGKWGQFVCFSRKVVDSITAFTSYCKLKTVFCLNRA